MERDIIKGCISSISRIDQIMAQFSAKDKEEAQYFPAFGLMFRIAEARNGSARIRMSDVSNYLHVTKSAATYVVKQLEERGSVKRSTSKDDRRVTYIEMTEKGRAAFEESMNRRAQSIGRALDRMGKDKADQFGALFNEFMEALSDEARNY